MFHGARRLLERGEGVFLYLPKLESHLEARLWNDAFQLAQDRLGVPRGTVKATVLIETITAAFEMDEILYELRDHSAGLNAGRWDYMFSVIKKFRNRPEFTLPDRNKVTMTVPFMRAYTQLLVKTCHRRGAFAMGGMSAFIPSRKRPEINEQAFAKVREDKQREAGDGFDGTWVAHPDLVPVAEEVFDEVLGERPNQVGRQRDDVQVGQGELLDIASTPGGDRGGAAQQRQRRHPVHLLLAARPGRGPDLQPDGGRGHRRDLPLPGLAVGPQRRQAERGTDRHRRPGPPDRHRGAGEDPPAGRRRVLLLRGSP